jgi:hypothetical protein
LGPSGSPLARCRGRYPVSIFLGIDHLVTDVADPADAAAQLERELGYGIGDARCCEVTGLAP